MFSIWMNTNIWIFSVAEYKFWYWIQSAFSHGFITLCHFKILPTALCFSILLYSLCTISLLFNIYCTM